MEIRSLNPEDQIFLWEILYYALYLPPNYQPFPRDVIYRPEIRSYAEGWGRPGDLGALALYSDQPVGAAWVRLFTENQQGFGYIDEFTPELSIAVLPTYRNKGIGTQLLTYVLQQTQFRFHAVCLSVVFENPSRRLYERFGFKIVDQRGASLTMIKHWQ